jgi:hypothetical protein
MTTAGTCYFNFNNGLNLGRLAVSGLLKEGAHTDWTPDRYINACDELVSFLSLCWRIHAKFRALGMIFGRIPYFVRPFRKWQCNHFI